MFTTTLRTLAVVALVGQVLAVRVEVFDADHHPMDGMPSLVPEENRRPIVALECQRLNGADEDSVAFREHCEVMFPSSTTAFDCQNPPALADKGNIWCGYEHLTITRGRQDHDSVWVGLDAMTPADMQDAITNHHNKQQANDNFWAMLMGKNNNNNNNQNPQEAD